MIQTIIVSALWAAFVGLTIREHYTLKISRIVNEYEEMLDAAARQIQDVDDEILTIPPPQVE